MLSWLQSIFLERITTWACCSGVRIFANADQDIQSSHNDLTRCQTTTQKIRRLAAQPLATQPQAKLSPRFPDRTSKISLPRKNTSKPIRSISNPSSSVRKHCKQTSINCATSRTATASSDRHNFMLPTCKFSLFAFLIPHFSFTKRMEVNGTQSWQAAQSARHA